MANIPSSNLEQLLTVTLDSKLVDVHTCLPAVIESFDTATQLCQVQVQIKRVIIDKDGNETTRAIPLIIDVPLMYSQTQDFVITMPVKKGDECLLFFSARDIDNWEDTGRLSDPRTRRRFHLSDGFAIPMIRSKPKRLTNYNADDLEIRLKNATSKIVMKQNGDIEVVNTTKIDITTPTLNINADVNVTGDVDVTGNVDATADVKAGAISLNSHVHGGVQSGGSNTGAPQ